VCTTVTTTRTWVSDPAAKAEAADLQRRMLAAMAVSEIPLETTIDVAARSLGGDTTGVSAQFIYFGRLRGIGPLRYTQLGMGVGFGRYTFHDRVRAVATPGSGDVLLGTMALEAADYRYGFLSSPIKLKIGLAPHLAAWFQADFNWYVLSHALFADEGDERPASALRFGLDASFGPARIGAEVAADGMRGDGVTLALEARFEL
jgi:hypothetical protein